MVRYVKTPEESGEFRGQGKWSGSGESRLSKGKESLGGKGSGHGPESQGSGKVRRV